MTEQGQEPENPERFRNNPLVLTAEVAPGHFIADADCQQVYAVLPQGLCAPVSLYCDGSKISAVFTGKTRETTEVGSIHVILVAFQTEGVFIFQKPREKPGCVERLRRVIN